MADALASVAAAIGFRGVVVRNVDELRDGLRLVGRERRLLLDCRVDPSIRGAWFLDAFGHDSWLKRSAAPRDEEGP